MSFRENFEKKLNDELQRDHPETFSSPPVIDVEDHQQHPSQGPPAFANYAPQPPPARRSGVFLPTPLFMLFVLVFLFESSVLFFYTLVGLYNTIPTAVLPAQHQNAGCYYGLTGNQPNGANVALIPGHNLGPPEQSTTASTTEHRVTVTVTASVTNNPESSQGVVSASASLDAGISAVLGALSSIQPTIHTVTAPAPTITILSTASSLPSITTQTVFSTATLDRPTVTSIALVTGS